MNRPGTNRSSVPGRSHHLLGSAEAIAVSHPAAPIPNPLFADPATESRWQARFSAVRISLPMPARNSQDRAVFVSNESGRYQLYCWDVAGGRRLQGTDRVEGTTVGVLSANGHGLWWFDDSDGDEFGRWMAQPFGAAPGTAGIALPDVPPGYSAGLEVGLGVVVAGFSDDEGTRVHLNRGGRGTQVVYRHATDAGVGALATDEKLWVLEHTEHGDSRYPALRAIMVDDGSIVAELDDSPGKGLCCLGFSPISGDQRLLVGHERRGRDELLIWDAASGETRDLDIALDGDLTGCFFRDGKAVLVLRTHHGRSTLHRYQLDTGELTGLPADAGTIDGALTRDGGGIWYRGSDGAHAARLRQLPGVDGPVAAGGVTTGGVTTGGMATDLLVPPGGPAPDSQPLTDLWVDGPGGGIHALLAVPADAPAPNLNGGSNSALPAVFLVHGGPDAADDDSYDAGRALWLEAGFAVVQVNYRGSSGYGSHWRDALTERVGHTELADVAAVQDRLVAQGAVDGDRCAIVGASWGGFLTLLALGSQPSRWAVGVAGVPVADYVASYRQEMEPLRAYDRALFGGSPDEVPSKYIDSSPISWIDQVRAPVLILAGANDPRCPIGQIENYLDALANRGAEYAVYRYHTGHGSMVVQERIRQAAVEVGHVRGALRATERTGEAGVIVGLAPPGSRAGTHPAGRPAGKVVPEPAAAARLTSRQPGIAVLPRDLVGPADLVSATSPAGRINGPPDPPS